MRIAVISVHGCPCIQPGGTDAGGMNVYVDQVSERMARLGHSVSVYSLLHAVPPNDHDDRSYELTHINLGEPSLRKDEIPDALPEFASAVREDAARGNLKFDIIASHYWLSGVAGRELALDWGIPHITSFHTIASLKKLVRPEEDEPAIRFEKESLVARDADGVVAWTIGERDHIAIEFGLSADKIAVIAPGVDTDLFSQLHESSKHDGGKRVLYVGRLDALKGVDLLLDAFALVIEKGVDAELQIVGGGSGEEFRRVLGRISKLRIADRVSLPGVLPQSELRAIYSEASCIVAPSFHETFGLAVLEAASCGIPAIASDVDGLRAIVADGETGFLIPERNADAYADKIVEVVSNESLRKRMSVAARKRAEMFSWNETVRRLIGIYSQFVDAREPTTRLR